MNIKKTQILANSSPAKEQETPNYTEIKTMSSMIHLKSNAFCPPNPRKSPTKKKKIKMHSPHGSHTRANLEKGMQSKPSQNPPGERRAGGKTGACLGADSRRIGARRSGRCGGGRGGVEKG